MRGHRTFSSIWSPLPPCRWSWSNTNDEPLVFASRLRFSTPFDAAKVQSQTMTGSTYPAFAHRKSKAHLSGFARPALQVDNWMLPCGSGGSPIAFQRMHSHRVAFSVRKDRIAQPWRGRMNSSAALTSLDPAARLRPVRRLPSQRRGRRGEEVPETGRWKGPQLSGSGAPLMLIWEHERS